MNAEYWFLLSEYQDINEYPNDSNVYYYAQVYRDSTISFLSLFYYSTLIKEQLPFMPLFAKRVNKFSIIHRFPLVMRLVLIIKSRHAPDFYIGD